MKVDLLTSSRADWGLWRPLAGRLAGAGATQLRILAFGAHVSSDHGMTRSEIVSDGFGAWLLPVDAPPLGDLPVDASRGIGSTCTACAEVWSESPADLVLALGDRYEMLAAVLAAVPFGRPVAHVHAGETTTGALDDRFRHAITQLSDCQFVALPAYRDRVIGMTGRPDRVRVVGALGLDNLRELEIMDPEEFREAFDFDIRRDHVLVTLHPETEAPSVNLPMTEALIRVLDGMKLPVLITMPNADPHAESIRRAFRRFAGEHDRVRLVESLGTRGYYAAMSHASLILGNSSSGILEAASFGRMVVDIGERQLGRLHGANVIHSDRDAGSIRAAVARALDSPDPGRVNPYDAGGAADLIMTGIRERIWEEN